jgi:hypothetical protein
MQRWERTSSNLSHNDKATIKKSLEYNYFRLGRYYLANGYSANARKALRTSLSHGFSLIGLIYLGLSFLPSVVLQWIRKTKRCLDIRTTIVERI